MRIFEGVGAYQNFLLLEWCLLKGGGCFRGRLIESLQYLSFNSDVAINFNSGVAIKRCSSK